MLITVESANELFLLFGTVWYGLVPVDVMPVPWWRHEMETFSALLALCEGEPPGTVTNASDAELWCFFHLRPNKRLRKQLRRWWFEMPWGSVWRFCNASADPGSNNATKKMGKQISSVSCLCPQEICVRPCIDEIRWLDISFWITLYIYENNTVWLKKWRPCVWNAAVQST